MTIRRLVTLSGALVLAGTSAEAQVQHSRAATIEAVRSEYFAVVLEGVNETLEHFRTAVAGDDARAVRNLFHEGAHYSPRAGESHYGLDALAEAFQERLAATGSVLFTRVDFTASGNLAYQFGRYVYGAGPDGLGREEGTYTMVLLQMGKTWRIRSLVERRDPPS